MFVMQLYRLSKGPQGVNTVREEHTLTHVACAECMKMCIIGESNQPLSYKSVNFCQIIKTVISEPLSFCVISESLKVKLFYETITMHYFQSIL